ncbi:cysteine proteinase inhibitor [Trifolium pratense]|uniref:Cysteine proteinase inhibitor n=1 Tax=Trifolium pratense TaxID=57577 RepID=A0A2K3MBY1_TRIPR|nr:cysteine proteinase inhibitor [Trifolium pratense]PNX88294.1 cysteine proteinase inhibitor [Trifolium pratense]
MAFVAAREQILLGGYSPIKNLNDPHVIDIAKFAVTEFNKQIGATLKFDKVIKGESQVVAGTNYRLIITTSNSVPNTYQAIVYENPGEHVRNLTSFTIVKTN